MRTFVLGLKGGLWASLSLVWLSACTDQNFKEKLTSQSLVEFANAPLNVPPEDVNIPADLPKVATAPSGFSGESKGFLGPIRSTQPNVVYLPRSGSTFSSTPDLTTAACSGSANCYDLLIWNGDDRFVSSSSSGSPDINASGLYIGEVRVRPSVAGSVEINIIKYFPPRVLTFSGKAVSPASSAGPVTAVYPTRLMGASLEKNGNVALVYVIGQEAHGVVLNKSALDQPFGTHSATSPIAIASDTTLTRNGGNAASAPPALGQEFEILTSTRPGDYFDQCLSTSSMASVPPWSSNDEGTVLAFGRGYQLQQVIPTGNPSNYNVGQQFSRFSYYHGGWSEPTPKVEELKTLRTNLPCDEKVAYNEASDTFGVLSYSDINLFRFSSVSGASPRKKGTDLYLYRGDASNKKDAVIAGLIPLAEGSSIPGGTAQDGAFMALAVIQGQGRLSELRRSDPTLEVFFINQVNTTGGKAYPDPQNEGAVLFPFDKNIDGGIGHPVATYYGGGSGAFVLARNTIFTLSRSGKLEFGPTKYNDLSAGPAASDRVEHLGATGSTLAWVTYDIMKLPSRVYFNRYTP